MYGNNEIGVVQPIKEIAAIAKKHGALFFTDGTQAVGKIPVDVMADGIDLMSFSGHKMYGPKGVGVLYINENIKITPFVHGGSQERNVRAGTENLYGIVGFAKALEIASEEYEKESNYIKRLKLYMMEQLKSNINGVVFNGDPLGASLYAVLSVSFPKTEKSEMILFNLDINNICASGGSACTSGADQGSHVIRAINNNPNQITVRFSFCKHNTTAEIDQVVEKLIELI
jgi:cysteine desulfurase